MAVVTMTSSRLQLILDGGIDEVSGMYKLSKNQDGLLLTV